MDASEIHDRASLEAWLNGRPPEDSIWIAHRAAMRVLPEWANPPSDAVLRKRGLTDLALLGSLLIAGVGCEYATPAIKDAAAAAAAAAALSASASASAAAAAAALSASAASLSFSAAVARAASVSAARAASVSAALSSADAIWYEVRQDCMRFQQGGSIEGKPLWSSAPNPLQDQWDQTRAKWQADPDYAFWLRWYEDALIGTPPNWPLLHDIALIENEEWEKGIAHIAAVIAGIEAAHRSDQVADDQFDDNNGQNQLPNKRVIQLQVSVLRSLIDDETLRLRGKNAKTNDQKDRLDRLQATLATILDLINEIELALEDQDRPTSHALVVIDDKLPAIVQEANSLAENGGKPKLSASIISMAATIKHLTDNGTPGHLASAFAFCDTAWANFKKWSSKSA